MIKRLLLTSCFLICLFGLKAGVVEAGGNGYHIETYPGNSPTNPCPWIRITSFGYDYPGPQLNVWRIRADVYDKSRNYMYVGTLQGGGGTGSQVSLIENKNFCGKDTDNPLDTSYKLNANNAYIWVTTIPYDPSVKGDPYTVNGWRPLAFAAPVDSPTKPTLAANSAIWVDAIHSVLPPDTAGKLYDTSPVNNQLLTDATFSQPFTRTFNSWGFRYNNDSGIEESIFFFDDNGVKRLTPGIDPRIGWDYASPPQTISAGSILQTGSGYNGTEYQRTSKVDIGKPNVFNDPYPLDGHYIWQVTTRDGAGLEAVEDITPNTNNLINAPWAMINRTPGTFWLLTNLQAGSLVTIDGTYPGNNGDYPVTPSTSISDSIINNSSKIAAQASQASLSLVGVPLGGGAATTYPSVIANVPVLNPSQSYPVTGSWGNLPPGNYSVTVCANNNLSVNSVSGRHCQSIPFNIFSPTPPIPNSVANPPCLGNIPLTWNKLDWAASYRVQVSTNLSFSPLSAEAVLVGANSTTYNFTVAEGTQYYWRVRVESGTGGTTGWSAVQNFKTPLCKRYSVSTSAVTPIAPGNSGTESVNVAVGGGSGPWQDGDVVTLSVNNDWGAGTCTSGIKNGINVTPGNKTSTFSHSTGLFSTPLAFTISTSASTAPGQYQICFTISTGTDQNVSPGQLTWIPFNFTVNYQSWLQVSAVNSAAGDIHSNGNFTMTASGVGNGYLYDVSILPYYPSAFAGQHNAGVVGAAGTLLLNTANGSVPPSPYLTAQSYSPISPASLMSTFTNLLGNARVQAGFSTHTLSGGSTLQSGNTGCAAPDQIGQVSSSGSGDFTLGSVNCSILIVGDPSNQANVKITGDVHNARPFILIVNGDVTVSPAVTNLDATIILTGNFNDGTNAPLSDSALTINGSVLEIGSGAISFNRYLTDNVTPAERIVYQPGQLDTLRTLIGTSTYSWVEKQ